nr:tetratricopeptide repeat protein [Variovorax boronicumulans]
MHGDIDAATPSEGPDGSAIAPLLSGAIGHHRAWEFAQAEEGYRAILAQWPGHADASHNLGVLLAVHLLRPAQALPLLEAAIDRQPQRRQFWLSYVDALIKDGQFSAARQVLPLARLQGVEDNLIHRLEDEMAQAEQPLPAIEGVRWRPQMSLPPAPQPHRPAKPAGRMPGPGLQETNELVTLFNRGAYEKAERLARRLAVRYPASGVVSKILGAVLQQMGQHADALTAKRRAAELLPDDPEVHCNLGNTLVSLGQPGDALECFQRAIALRPDYAQAYFNRGNALLALDRPAQAETDFRSARDLAPDWVDVHSNLGFALKAQGRLGDAVESYLHALALAPQDATTLGNLGILYDALGQGDKALQCLGLSLAQQPGDAQTHSAHGAALHRQGKLSMAETAYRKALQLDAQCLPALKRLGLLLQQQGRLEEAETCLRRCLLAEPDSPSAHFDLGTNLIEQKRWDEAEAALRAALALKPDYAEAHINLSKSIYERGDYDRAVVVIEQSLQVLPAVPSLHTNLGVSHTMQGFVDKAIACYRRALAIDPQFDYARSCMLYALSHSAQVGAQELAQEHRRYGELLEARVGAAATVHANGRQAGRQLRVGFVSADFRDHALAKFFEPFIERFARLPEFSCVAYYNHAARDATTRRIDASFETWRPVVGLSDERLFRQIQDDGIDILIDLTSHTAGNRLAVFARKPAPVQITWMGYPGSTGLRSMDYRFVEHFFLPSDAFGAQFTERLVQLPLVSPFNGVESMPDVGPAPALANGHITFGSFNRLSKINHDVVMAWAEVLRAVPDSRLLLAGLPAHSEPEQILAWLHDAGVVRERVILQPRTGFYDYMQLHNRVDIGLDTFPYTGGTTTNHALWMGVPTLTIAGDTLPSRQSAMFLNRVGLRDFIATDVAGLVDRATAWSRNVAGLQTIRARLRPQLQTANATQLETVVAGVSVALRRMWSRWCEGLPTQAFRVEYEEVGAHDPHAARGQEELA